MNITFFGPLTDITGANTVTLEEIPDTDALRARLEERFPGLQDRKFVISVNNKVVRDNTPLTSTSEVALLPPFSGG
jgi:molybdopterin converting factor small subunit